MNDYKVSRKKSKRIVNSWRWRRGNGFPENACVILRGPTPERELVYDIMLEKVKLARVAVSRESGELIVWWQTKSEHSTMG